MPLIEALAKRFAAPLSIDTRKAAVAEAALAAGARIVNDVSGLRFDPALAGVVARAGAALVVGHSRGTPETMQMRAPLRRGDRRGGGRAARVARGRARGGRGRARARDRSRDRLRQAARGQPRAAGADRRAARRGRRRPARAGRPVAQGVSSAGSRATTAGRPRRRHATPRARSRSTRAPTRCACTTSRARCARARWRARCASVRRGEPAGRERGMIETLWGAVRNLLEYFGANFDPVRDVIDIVLVTIGIYWLLVLIRGTRAFQIMLGLLVLLRDERGVRDLPARDAAHAARELRAVRRADRDRAVPARHPPRARARGARLLPVRGAPARDADPRGGGARVPGARAQADRRADRARARDRARGPDRDRHAARRRGAQGPAALGVQSRTRRCTTAR